MSCMITGREFNLFLSMKSFKLFWKHSTGILDFDFDYDSIPVSTTLLFVELFYSFPCLNRNGKITAFLENVRFATGKPAPNQHCCLPIQIYYACL
jgi:hypothetical protein